MISDESPKLGQQASLTELRRFYQQDETRTMKVAQCDPHNAHDGICAMEQDGARTVKAAVRG